MSPRRSLFAPACFISLTFNVFGADLPSAPPPPPTAAAPVVARPNAPEVLPGKGLAQHPFLYAGEWDFRRPLQTLFIIRDGKVAWTYDIKLKTDSGEIQEYSDATMLSNGDIVFARKTGADKVTPEKKIMWSYDAPKGFEVHVCQPLGLDRVMIVQNGNPASMMIFNTVTNTKLKEFNLPTGNPKGTHGQFRRARLTAAGTLLAAHMDMGKVCEYDGDGKEIWSVALPSPWAAVRLANGNTLVTSNKGFAREVNPKGETVWEFTREDSPDIRLFGVQEANRLANGNTVINSWCPNSVKDPKDWPTSVQVIEVTPGKKIVWALRSWDEPANLGPSTCVQLLDEPGVAENFGQQR